MAAALGGSRMRSVRSNVGLLAFVAALAPSATWADGGLVVRLADGSTPVNRPDLFANALSRAWGDGSRFCAALKSLLPVPGGPYSANGGVTSCAAQPYGITGVSVSGHTATVLFSAKVTLQGASPDENRTCPFTDTLTVSLQAPLTITGAVYTISSIGFAPATFTAPVQETWGAPCTNRSGDHPGGLSSLEPVFARTAASSVNFPGDALNNAFAPYAGPMQHALTGMAYTLSGASGDAVYTVTGSMLHQRLDETSRMRGRF